MAVPLVMCKDYLRAAIRASPSFTVSGERQVMAMSYTEIGQRLRAAREARGKTQAQIARSLEMTRQNVSLIEAGSNHADLDVLEQYARLVGCPIVFDLGAADYAAVLLLQRLSRVVRSLDTAVLETLSAMVDRWEGQHLGHRRVG